MALGGGSAGRTPPAQSQVQTLARLNSHMPPTRPTVQLPPSSPYRALSVSPGGSVAQAQSPLTSAPEARSVPLTSAPVWLRHGQWGSGRPGECSHLGGCSSPSSGIHVSQPCAKALSPVPLALHKILSSLKQKHKQLFPKILSCTWGKENSPFNLIRLLIFPKYRSEFFLNARPREPPPDYHSQYTASASCFPSARPFIYTRPH